jgi:hypothetical protein
VILDLPLELIVSQNLYTFAVPTPSRDPVCTRGPRLNKLQV